MSNVLTITITNTYKGTRNELKKSMDQTRINLKNSIISKKTLTYNFEDELATNIFSTLDALDKIKKEKDSSLKNKDTLLLIYSGHGFFDFNNNIAGLYDEKMNMYNLIDLVNYFKSYKNLYILIEACQTEDVDFKKKNFDTNILSNKHIIISYPAQQYCPALTNINTGGYLTKNFFDSAKLFDDNKIINFNETISTLDYLFLIREAYKSYSEEMKSIKRESVPQIWTNKQTRDEYPEILDKIKTYSDKINYVTKIRDKMELNYKYKETCDLIQKMINLKKKELSNFIDNKFKIKSNDNIFFYLFFDAKFKKTNEQKYELKKYEYKNLANKDFKKNIIDDLSAIKEQKSPTYDPIVTNLLNQIIEYNDKYDYYECQNMIIK